MIDFIVATLASILAAMGVGGGGLLVIYLVLIKDMAQITAQGINLLYFLPSASISVFLQRKCLGKEIKLLLLLCAVGTASAAASSLLVGKISNDTLQRGFGIFLVCAGVYQFFKGKGEK